MVTSIFGDHYSFLSGLSTDRPCKRRLDRKRDPRYGVYQKKHFKDQSMEEYKERLAITLAETGALFFGRNLVLKDGRPTPYFVNMGMFRTGRLSKEMGTFFASMIVRRGVGDQTDVILGPSYKGSAIALATAIALYMNYGRDLLFEYDRKEAKSHGEGSQVESLFVNRAFFEGCRVFVVDDVATSMGTKVELIEKVNREARAKKINVKIVGIGIAIDREQTTAVYDNEGRVIQGQKGRNAIEEFVRSSGIPIYCVAGIREVMEFIYHERVPVLVEGKRKPLDEKIMLSFREYMKTYGTD
jgi:orotate phosphoribosyltransferase